MNVGEGVAMQSANTLIIAILLTMTTIIAPPSSAYAQHPDQQAGAGTPAPATSRRAWRVTISRVGSQSFVKLRARNARVTDIAAELSRQLKVPVVLSHFMKTRRVTLSFDDQPLETALLLLAPQSWADYEISGVAGAQPKLLAVYLQAYNDAPPPVNLGGANSGMVIEGNTEDEVETAEVKNSDEPPLSVTFQNNQLSITAHRQLLISVLSEVARRTGSTLDVRNITQETVDINFRDIALEDAPLLISPSVRFRLRTDLSTQYRVPLLITLDAKPEQREKPGSVNRN